MIRIALILALLTAPAFGATFYPLDASYVEAISADGSVAVANLTSKSGAASGGMLWTRQRTVDFGTVNDLSADGSTVASGNEAWTADGVKFSASSPIVGVSGDGSKAVSRDGTLFTAAGQTKLGFSAADISADGNWIVGVKDGLPYLWNGEGKYLADKPAYEAIFHAYVSDDGSIVYFQDYITYRATRWQEETGAVQNPYLGRLTGVSSNGRFALGGAKWEFLNDEGETNLFTPDGDVVPSDAYADGWILFATAVSDDGLTIGGRGFNFATKQYQAWIYDSRDDWLPADANRDGQVNLSDFGTLKANFGSGRSWSYGDFNGSWKIDLSDFGILKDNFGQTTPNAVPEPSTWLLASWASLLCFLHTARRRRGLAAKITN